MMSKGKSLKKTKPIFAYAIVDKETNQIAHHDDGRNIILAKYKKDLKKVYLVGDSKKYYKVIKVIIKSVK